MVSILTGEARDLVDRSTRPQSLIITIYGAFSRNNGGWFAANSIIQLCAELGVQEDATRSALARFKRRGILISKKQDGVAGYSMSPEMRRTFDQGDSRVLQRRNPALNEGWILVAFSIPEEMRAIRYQLRSRLIRIGFAQVTGGLWIAPRQLSQDAISLAQSLQIEKYMDIFSAEHMAFQPAATAVAGWWDLTGIQEVYKSFSKTAKPTAAYWAKKRGSPDPQQAFHDYTKILTNWRHVPYFDPGLPKEFLPKNWAGVAATETFFKIHDKLAGAALNYVINLAKK
jgi:phenylacetic acid degradation operon negative regulatory protein